MAACGIVFEYAKRTIEYGDVAQLGEQLLDV